VLVTWLHLLLAASLVLVHLLLLLGLLQSVRLAIEDLRIASGGLSFQVLLVAGDTVHQIMSLHLLVVVTRYNLGVNSVWLCSVGHALTKTSCTGRLSYRLLVLLEASMITLTHSGVVIILILVCHRKLGISKRLHFSISVGHLIILSFVQS